MTARKDSSNAAANLLSSLRPVIAFDVMERAVPGEALELESALWTPLRRAIDNTLTPEEKKACLLKAAVTAPQVVSALTGCCPGVFGVDGDHKNWGKLARALIAAEVCAVLRKAFLALSSSINQASDGYEHLVSAACRVARKWIDTPPENPVRELPLGLSESGIGLRPSPNEGFIRDFDIATGKEPVDGRTPAWPEHALFTRSHLAERACWFRDVGIRCFGLGEHETARRLFRLAINSKLEGVYSVWNMARLQTALRHFDNAEAFYRAALDFPMPPALKQTIQTELEGCRSDDISLRGPVPPGAGQDRAEEMPVESTSERRG